MKSLKVQGLEAEEVVAPPGCIGLSIKQSVSVRGTLGRSVEVTVEREDGKTQSGPGPAMGAWRLWLAGGGITILIVVGYLYLRRRVTREASTAG